MEVGLSKGHSSLIVYYHKYGTYQLLRNILSRLRANQSLILPVNAVCLTEK
jgi:hypothetical protein